MYQKNNYYSTLIKSLREIKLSDAASDGIAVLNFSIKSASKGNDIAFIFRKI